VHADEPLAFNLVAIALIAQAGQPESFGIGEIDLSALAAADGQLRIGGGEECLVE